ncbi:MAG: hypothetical protein AMXMBFR7_43090 [Planctomycetota bacterium]
MRRNHWIAGLLAIGLAASSAWAGPELKAPSAVPERAPGQEQPAEAKVNQAEIQKLIQQLNAPEVEDREKAEQALIAIGEPALVPLKVAQLSPIPEIAARAQKLALTIGGVGAMPMDGYAPLYPARSIFFLEAADFRRTALRIAQSPIGQTWARPEIQTWWRKYKQQELSEDELAEVGLYGRIAGMLDGRGALVLGPPESVKDEDLDPPFAVFLQHKSAPGQMEPALREYFELEGDTPDEGRDERGMRVFEHALGGQSIFLPQTSFFGFSASALALLQEALAKAPEASLKPYAERAAKLFPDSDFTLHLSRDGLDLLETVTDNIMLFDFFTTLDSLGFVKGGHAMGAWLVDATGVQERYLVKLGDPKGLIPAWGQSAAAAAPGEGPRALEALPPHTAAWISLRGNFAANSAACAESLRQYEKARMGLLTDPGVAAPIPLPVVETTVSAIEKVLGPFDALLAQVEGPLELGWLVKNIGEDLPPDPPLALIVSAVLKDPAPVLAALEAACQGEKAEWMKQEQSGGLFFRPKDDPEAGGCWIQERRFVYASEPEVMKLTWAAVAHANGNERLADRADVQEFLKDADLAPNATVVGFGNGGQVLELPFQLWNNLYGTPNEANLPPAFAPLRPLLGQLRFQLIPPAAEGQEWEIRARSPVSLPGLFYLLHRPFFDLGW